MSSDWGFNAYIGWSWREIEGEVYEFEPPFGGAASADSLGLGTSSKAEAAIGARWQRLYVEFIYLPSQFSGDGEILEFLDFGPGLVIDITEPVKSDIKVTLYLAKVEYMLLQRNDMELGLGVGIGNVEIGINMATETGTSEYISGDAPLGYLTGTFTKRWEKVSFTLNLQTIGFTDNTSRAGYGSANILGAYQATQHDNLILEVIGGYRYVDLDFEFNDVSTGIESSTNIKLTGPYVGVRMVW